MVLDNNRKIKRRIAKNDTQRKIFAIILPFPYFSIILFSEFSLSRVMSLSALLALSRTCTPHTP